MGKQPPRAKQRRSDATFWRDGTTTDHAFWGPAQAWWWRLAGWKKATMAAATAALGYGLLEHRTGTEWLLACVLGPAAGVYAVLGFRRLQGWRHYWIKVKPLAFALEPVLDQPAREARSWLYVPWDYATREDAEVVVDVPGDFTGGDRDMEDVTRAVTAKLSFPNAEVEKKLGGRRPHLVYHRPSPPPAVVSLADIRPHIDAAGIHEVILGLGRKDRDTGKYRVVGIDMDTETPHAAGSMTTGDGKSELAKNFGAQWCYHGGILMILDYKLVSHMWAEGLPNVSYAGTPEEIHAALCWLAWDDRDDDGNLLRACELTRRKQVIKASADIAGQATASPGPPLLVLAEERNATQRALKRYWRRIGGKGPSPAVEALDEVGETGRQLDAHVLYIAQRLSAKASGGDGTADARENIGAIITKDPTDATWKMLAGGHAQPPKTGHPGRYQLIMRKGVEEFQGALYDSDKVKAARLARELAIAGKIGEPRADMPFVYRPDPFVLAGIGRETIARQESPEQGFVSTQDAGVLPAGQGPARAVKLAEAVAAELFVSVAAARKAAQRQGWEPVGGDKYTGYEYAVTDIYKYIQSRGRR